MKNQQKINKAKKLIRRRRVQVKGTPDRPRLSIFRSLKHIHAQLVDDVKGITLVFAKDLEIKEADKKDDKTKLAYKVGELIAAKAKKAGISQVVFDKSSYKYHGRVKALADGARKGGLKF
jgi:large subunit ribosomal protein L18